MKQLMNIVVVGVVLLAGSSFAGTYSGGSGTEGDPYQIADANDLLELGVTTDDYDKHFIMTADIDLTGYVFDKAVIAPDEDGTTEAFEGTPFTGVFDGDGFIISNLLIRAGNEYTTWNVGFIGRLSGAEAEIRNLKLEAPDITFSDEYEDGGYFGILCAYSNLGKITNCQVTGLSWNLDYVFAGEGLQFFGGLCGGNSGIIRDCYTTGSVKSGDYAYYLGGICGVNDGTISDCYTTCSVNGGWSVGGLCGENRGSITDCYTTCSVVGERGPIGGLCGLNETGSIMNCYATGEVTCTNVDYQMTNSIHVGGLCGRNRLGQIHNSYSTGRVNDGYGLAGGLCGSNFKGTISHSHSTGEVDSGCTGGLCGYNTGMITSCYATGGKGGGLCYLNSGIITSCYATGVGDGLCCYNQGGLISNCYTTNRGALCNENWDNNSIISNCYSTGGAVCIDNWGTIVNCFWDMEASGEDWSDGGTGLTTEYMQKLTTFTNWDFINTWNIGENQTYPYLRTHSASDLNKDRVVNLIDLSIMAGQWMCGAQLTPAMTYKVGECDMEGAPPADNELRFTVKVDGSYIDFEDPIYANCCIENGIRLDMLLKGDIITITETELSEGICDCMCNYPTTARLGPFEPGTYTIQVDQVNHSGYVTSIGRVEVIISSGQ